jgi:hypothetical protein
MPGTITISTLSDGTNSTSATNLVRGPCVAWVNFNGTGAVAIRGSYNISSVTRITTGSYLITYTNALANANYCCQVTSNSYFGMTPVTTTSNAGGTNTSSTSTTQQQVNTSYIANTIGGSLPTDMAEIMVSFFNS